MADIVNLRRFRKTRVRQDAETLAGANRIAFGRTKVERLATAALEEKAARSLDGHRLVDRDADNPPSSD